MIAVDLPGFGESELPLDDITIPGYGRFVDAFLGEIGVERAPLVGNSMGGFIAAEVAVSHPSRVEQLVLVSAAGLGDRAGPPARACEARRSLFHYGMARTIARREHWVRRPRMRRMFLYGVATHPDLLQPELCYEIASGGGKPGFIDAFSAILDYDFRDRLSDVRHPTLIVWGRQDKIVPVAGAHEYERLIPGSRKVIFEDTGHVPMIERPHRFNRLLEEFLASCAQRVIAPSDADDTERAYFAITPFSYFGGGDCQSAMRRSISSCGRSSSRRRLSMSNSIVSPSRTAAIGPPCGASGATCPAIRPRVAPEKRPSVSSATLSPRPSPTSAAVTSSISRMPGPPLGPSLRITTTSPGSIRPAVTASIASSSHSNTRAGPRWVVRS